MHARPDQPRQDQDDTLLAHRLATPVAKLRLYAGTLGKTLPGLLGARATGGTPAAAPTAALAAELLAIVPDIPARLARLADEFEEIMDELRGRPGPVAARLDREAAAAIPAALSAGDPERPLPRVLLVEDDADSRDLMALALARAGWRVVLAGDGRPALDLIDRERFDLILMDCRLPELDGWDATARLRAAGPNRDTPVIGLTASPDAADEARGRAAGMDDWIIKPLTAAHLAGLRRLSHPTAPTHP